MMLSISNALMSENTYVQTSLYSIPIINVITRIYQRFHSFEVLEKRNALNKESFDKQQLHFKGGLIFGSVIQVVAGLAIECLFPGSSIAPIGAYSVLTLFGCHCLLTSPCLNSTLYIL